MLHDMAGTLERIWIKRNKRGLMDPVHVASLRANRGIVSNANQGGRRQVTLLEAERWESHMRALGASLDPSARRANLLLRGLSLAGMRGRTLRIGHVRLQIAGETKPCHQMDEVLQGLQAEMRPHWGGGAFAVVLDDGQIAVGDPVDWDAVAAADLQTSFL
jgi:MOSC domain-containing protein YiiM